MRNLTAFTEQGMEELKFTGLFFETRRKNTLYTGAYTNHHLSILLDR
jgi:hypothetical protein